MSLTGISIVVMVLSNLDVTSSQHDRFDSGVSVYGYKYVIALPEYRVTRNFFQLHYVLHTVSPWIVNVSVKKVWSMDSTPMNRVYSITSGQHLVVKLDDHFWGSSLKMQTRWTHVLEALSMFAVQVYLKSERHDVVAYFQAVSEWAWLNSYIVFTPNYRPSLQIVNGAKEQTVRFKPPSNRVLQLITLFIEYLNIDYQYTYLLRRYEGFSIQLCSGSTEYNNLTGSRVVAAHPVGVIVGNCFYQQADVRNGSECVQDVTLEMLRGETNYSIEFLVGKTSALDGYLYIVFTSDNTSVHMATVNWETTIYNHKRVDMSLHKEFDCPVFVKSNKPITLALVMTSATPCNGHNFGELSLNQYVPNEMLMDNYQWVTDDDPRFSHRLLFIFQSGTAQFTYFDHLRMDRSYIFTHAKYKSYRDQFLVEFEISPGYHQLYSTRHYKLQAYIFGISNRENYTRAAYMQPVGFIAMHGGSLYECWPTNMNVKGDMIDNDCDNRIDEEIENKLDDDGDGLIDEDRGKTKLTNGQWAIWETWQCESSFDTIKTRTRFCNNPPPCNNGLNCQGISYEVETLLNEHCFDIVNGIVHGDWSISSYTCIDCQNGSGSANVSRKCDNPAPKRGGRSCSGQPIAIIELKECTDRCAHTKFMTASTTASHDGSSSSSDASQPKIYLTPTPSKYTIVPTAGSAKYTTDDIRNSTNSTNADSPTSSESTNNISTPINISSTKSVTSANIGTRMSSTLSNLSSTASATASVKSGTTKSSKLSTQTTNVTSTTIDQTITLNLNTTSYLPVTEAILYPGMWGQWSVWGCMENCTVKNVIRTRPCADAPEGPRSFDCPGYAYQFGYETTCNLICATTCTDGMWGFNCSKKCPNCEDACDKLTGHCIKCKPGYQNPQNHCAEVCPAFTFGYDCLGDCGANCEGHDCVEREHGVCPAIALKKTLIYGLFAILIIPVCILCNLSATKPRYNKEEGTGLRKPVNKTSSPPLKVTQIEQESEA